MEEIIPQKDIHRLFEVGVVLKGLGAGHEVALGALLFFVDVRGIVETLARNELLEDPTDFIGTHLQSLTVQFSAQAELSTALYLVSHGLIKGALVVGLLRGKMWAYPASLAVFSLFIVYEGIQFLDTRFIGVGLLAAFDLVVVLLIWYEYRLRLQHVRATV